MNEELRPCWCGRFPELLTARNGRGEKVIEYICDQSIDEYLPHVLLADDAESEEKARQNWNRMMNAIESHYQSKYSMKTCADCRYWNDFGGVCRNSSTLNFCYIRNGGHSCEDFKPKQKGKNEDDA